MKENESIALMGSPVSPLETYSDVDSKSSAEMDDERFKKERHDILSQSHDTAMNTIGFGRFQWFVFVVIGLAMMADMAEIFLTAFVMSSAARELCMDSEKQGLLGIMVMAGMMVGAVTFGVMADLVGRRPMLISGLLCALVMAIVSAFTHLYGLFLTCRTIVGINVGGLLSLWGPYMVELVPRHRRGVHLTFALFMWLTGAVYACAMAWIIIPNPDLSSHIHSGFVLSSWRIYLLVCALPILLALMGVFFVPETPRYLIEDGQIMEALKVYQRMYLQNHPGETQVPDISIPDIAHLNTVNSTDCCSRLLAGLSNHCSSIRQIFTKDYFLLTLLFSACWFTVSFATYGLDIWFPQYLSKLQLNNYLAKENKTVNVSLSNAVFTGLLDNIEYRNARFENVSFRQLKLRHVTFVDSTFDSCTFYEITSLQTRFINTSLVNTSFNNTDLFKYKFQQVDIRNSQFFHTRTECMVDFEINVDMAKGYFETLIGQLANYPGVVVSAILMDKVGRKKCTVVSFFIAALSTFLMWALTTEVSVVAVYSILNCFLMLVWNPLEVASTESHPTYLRNTAFGVFNASGKLAGLLGNIVFALFVNLDVSIPILTTTTMLIIGGLLSTQLPETKDNLT